MQHNYTKNHTNLAESSGCANHDTDENWVQEPLMPRQKHNDFAHIVFYMSFWASNGFWALALPLWTAKDMSKLEIHKLFWKARSMVLNRAIKDWYTHKHTRTCRLVEYIYQSSSCLEIIWLWLGGVLYHYFKRLVPQGKLEIWWTLLYNITLQNLL